ncbi:hypothetical protein SELMODRAFT_413298 [Selaginella moellendorffii]|uniref:Uncharacterized protein n=1 Tax=Selaginella moellendorffii TaxID=88036 RepID=D8RP03_SELML|nr:hypothetical protein SELMODRAFT_413298 [Selaginella moellendorffii]
MRPRSSPPSISKRGRVKGVEFSMMLQCKRVTEENMDQMPLPPVVKTRTKKEKALKAIQNVSKRPLAGELIVSDELITTREEAVNKKQSISAEMKDEKLEFGEGMDWDTHTYVREIYNIVMEMRKGWTLQS